MITRRGLLSVLGGRAPASPPGVQPKPFSLGEFYSKREPARTLPAFQVRDDGVTTETTRVGVPRRARIHEGACLAHRSFCTVCSERCPIAGAIVVELGKPRIVDGLCDGCGMCASVCPAPTNAISLDPPLAGRVAR